MLLDDGGSESFCEVIQLGLKFFSDASFDAGQFEAPSRMITRSDGKRRSVMEIYTVGDFRRVICGLPVDHFPDHSQLRADRSQQLPESWIGAQPVKTRLDS